jgi:hypothetical protein
LHCPEGNEMLQRFETRRQQIPITHEPLPRCE